MKLIERIKRKMVQIGMGNPPMDTEDNKLDASKRYADTIGCDFFDPRTPIIIPPIREVNYGIKRIRRSYNPREIRGDNKEEYMRYLEKGVAEYLIKEGAFGFLWHENHIEVFYVEGAGMAEAERCREETELHRPHWLNNNQ